MGSTPDEESGARGIQAAMEEAREGQVLQSLLWVLVCGEVVCPGVSDSQHCATKQGQETLTFIGPALATS